MFIQMRAKFREPSLGIRDFEKVLRRQGKVIEALARSYPEHDKTNWRSKGDTEDLAKLFPVFDMNGPSRIGLAELRQQFRKEHNRSFVAIWDGLKAPRVDCSMACHVGPPEDAHTLKVDLMRLLPFDAWRKFGAHRRTLRAWACRGAAPRGGARPITNAPVAVKSRARSWRHENRSIRACAAKNTPKSRGRRFGVQGWAQLWRLPPGQPFGSSSKVGVISSEFSCCRRFTLT